MNGIRTVEMRLNWTDPMIDHEETKSSIYGHIGIRFYTYKETVATHALTLMCHLLFP